MKEIKAKEALATSKAVSFMGTIMDRIQEACSKGRTEIRLADFEFSLPQNDIAKLRDLGYEVVEDLTGKFNAMVISWGKAA